ncbi:periphilin-1-like [Lemur catta]|uniref:periphilin-1-like n=1 Tax=Lemur catta TaxID=9447 RepID=UPI001E26AEFD|nr:periphilin-1-like [Lemur catta]
MMDKQSGLQAEESSPKWKTRQAQIMTWGQLKRTYKAADRTLNQTSVPKTSVNIFLAMICMFGENSEEDKNPETNASL